MTTPDKLPADFSKLPEQKLAPERCRYCRGPVDPGTGLTGNRDDGTKWAAHAWCYRKAMEGKK